VSTQPLDFRVKRLENDVTSIYDLLTEIQGGQKKQARQITELDERLAGRMDGLAGRMDGLAGRMDGLDGRMDTLDGKIDQVLDLLRK
jgi:hypothetical protein